MKTLALSTKVQNGVKPPAKKHEVIAAMVGETAPDLRVKSRVETPETRKAIEKMLSILEAPKQPEAIAA